VNMFRIMFLLWCDPVREADVSEIVFPPVWWAERVEPGAMLEHQVAGSGRRQNL
jgi:hypothetical protein